MQPTGWVSLLSDFGECDTYVGVMKGVLVSLNPAVRWLDLTHGIAPQDVDSAAWQLAGAIAYLPQGWVHLAVVDPGVGGDRQGVAIAFERGWLVGPDNGLFSQVLGTYEVQAAVVLNRPDYWWPGLGANGFPSATFPSATFHGRDIFAPVAAHLSRGVALADLGDAIAPDQLVRSPGAGYREVSEGVIQGVIRGIDRFGNAITSIPAAALGSGEIGGSGEVGGSWQLWIQDQVQAIPLTWTYSSVPPGEALAVVGSAGWVEIAVNQGSAAIALGLKPGDPVQMAWA